MPLTNNTNAVSLFASNGKSLDRVQMNAFGQLEVEVKNTAPIDVSANFTADISGQYVNVNNFPATQAVVATSLPLPTNAATDTLQTAGNTILNDIKTNTTQEAGAYSFSKALPVLLTTYEGGSSLNVVGSQSGNVKVYIDDANPDFVANSGMATGTKQDEIKTALEGTLTTTSLEGFSTTTLFSSQIVVASSNATSSSVDLSGYRMVNILGNDTETAFVNNLEMEVSTDNTTFYKWSNFSHSPDASSGDFGFQIAGLGVRYVRFKYVNNDSISHTISAILVLRKN